MAVLAVNSGEAGPDEIRKCFQRDRFPFPGLRQKGKEVSERYSVNSSPANFVIGRDGRVAARFMGFPVGTLREALTQATKP